MLELKKIKKIYESGSFRQVALNNVSMTFRDKEFVSILGPSGSGKTTLLNIIGGLDDYTSGDLIIDGTSTKKYRSRDWDSYRNHRIGFIFQSYNLISHQSILRNVELAMTLSGVPRKERIRRAKKALKDVGLAQHINKRPNQLSGGQMQRVAIARALVNDPDIILADEPTGALDSETSVQIMNLLKKVAEDRLVIMVTHNPELAEQYSTRIVSLKDGKIISDTDPYKLRGRRKSNTDDKTHRKRLRKTSMSFWTATGLSLNNLLTKKGRTFLTAIAGSIGIIGIAMILSLSNGIQEYIDRTEEETLSEYPISLQKQSVDISAFATAFAGGDSSNTYDDDKIHSRNIMGDVLTSVSSTTANNLKDFKKYLESNEGQTIRDNTSSISYGWNVPIDIYKNSTDEVLQVNPSSAMDAVGMGMDGMSSMMMNMDIFASIGSNEELLNQMYDVVDGRWPESYDELILSIGENGEISDYTLYTIGLLPQDDLKEALEKITAGEKVEFANTSYSKEDLMNLKFRLVLPTDYYKKEGGIWVDMRSDEKYMEEVLKKAPELKVVGIVKPNGESALTSSFPGYFGYKDELEEYVINKVNQSEIVKAQKANKQVNVLTGKKFGSEEKFTAENLTPEQQAYLATLNAEELATVVNSYQENANATYDSVLQTLGAAELDNPDEISLFPINFEAKTKIEQAIADYNEGKPEEDQITYSDQVGMMISAISTIVDVVSAVLIAFVAISLVVSSIMIAIITYISVLERTKEIGILRAIGASKRDVSRIFNAETLIEGLFAGVLGIGVTLLLCIPANAIIKEALDVSNLAVLPVAGAVILIILSVLLTVLAGLIPARLASKKDPVEALRSE